MAGETKETALLDPAGDPLIVFGRWFEEAAANEPNDPEAMALATVGADGQPSLRMVLLKAWDAAGFVFYTNRESQKGRELDHHPQAALLFHWKSLRRQVRIEGVVEEVSSEQADAYFASRPRTAQIGAWASAQSRPLESRLAFEAAIARNTAKFGLRAVPRPPYWIGYRVAPRAIEFWQDRKFRLHDRVRHEREGEGWRAIRLYP